MRTKYDTDSGLSPEDDNRIDEIIRKLTMFGCNKKDIMMTTLLLGIIFEIREDNERIEEKLDEILEKHFK